MTDKKTTELMTHLDNTLSQLWNASMAMDKVAEDCKVTKGEALIDRILKCEASLKAWEKELNSLDSDLATLKKLIAGFKEKEHGSIASIAEGVMNTALLKAKEMRASQQGYAKEFEGHKATLRKIKA